MRTNRLVALLVAATTTTACLVVAPSSRAEDPIVKLVSATSGKCLQPLNASPGEGEPIVQARCNGSRAQQWTVSLVSSTAVHLVNRASRLCMDARGKAVNGTPIDQWTCNWISNENWSFGITNDMLVSAVSNSFSHCIASPGTQEALPMELRFCDGNWSQRWLRPNG